MRRAWPARRERPRRCWMRLVGIALLSAWLLAWWGSPHGEPARQASIVGAVAVAGGDRAAVAWLELRHGIPGESGRLHVALVDEDGRVAPRLQMSIGPDAAGFRLVDAGDGGFVLATELRRQDSRWFELYRFDRGG